MIAHPAMPCICNDMDNAEESSEETFRSLVKWLEEHNMIGLGKQSNELGLLITIEDWQSLRQAAGGEEK